MRTPSTLPLAALLLGSVAGILGAQTTHFVSTQPGEFATVAAAIAVAVSGDVVVVRPGTYHASDLRFLGKAITLRSEAGPLQTTLTPQAPPGSAPVQGIVVFDMGEGPASRLEGFTLSGLTGSGGAALHCVGTSPTIARCIVRDNVGGAAGALVAAAGASPLIADSILRNNSGVAAGGVFATTAAYARLRGTTLQGNLGLDGGAAFVAADSGLEMRNVVSWENVPVEIDDQGGFVSIGTSIVSGGWPGAGVLDVDPLFLDAAAGDLRLSPVSPGIDAGLDLVPVSGSDPFGGARVVGAAVDLGAHELQQVFPGTREDLVLRIALADPASGALQPVAQAGDLLSVDLASPQGTFAWSPYLLLAALVTPGAPGAMVLPEIHLDPSTASVLVGPASNNPFGFPLLLPTGVLHQYVVPPGLGGQELRLQAAVVDAGADNRVYASSYALRIPIVP